MKKFEKSNMKIVLDTLDETIKKRCKLADKYQASGDPVKHKIAAALENNLDTLVKIKSEIIRAEKAAETIIFGD
jgi:hypothetical protein